MDTHTHTTTAACWHAGTISVRHAQYSWAAGLGGDVQERGVNDFPTGQFERRRITTCVNTPPAATALGRRRIDDYDDSTLDAQPSNHLPRHGTAPCTPIKTPASPSTSQSRRDILAVSFAACSSTPWSNVYDANTTRLRLCPRNTSRNRRRKPAPEKPAP